MKEMIVRIWKKWFGKEAGQVKDNVVVGIPEKTPLVEKTRSSTLMLQKLEKYLFSRYDFRFNVLTEQSEYALKGNTDFRMVDQRVLNTLCMDARSQGINCWDKDVSRLLLSQKIVDFHPFLYYMAHLPEWDGTDRVSELARRISDKPLWVNGFHRWMLAMAAQWMNLDGQCADSIGEEVPS